MKKLLRRLSGVTDSSHYSLLRTDSRISRRSRTPKTHRSAVVHEGHIPVYVGDEMERFIVSAELLNHPIFINLLNQSAQEYGYEQKGVLRIPCQVLKFERILEVMRLGQEAIYDQQQQQLDNGDEFLC